MIILIIIIIILALSHLVTWLFLLLCGLSTYICIILLIFRPNNLVFGRLFDYHILDMIELGNFIDM